MCLSSLLGISGGLNYLAFTNPTTAPLRSALDLMRTPDLTETEREILAATLRMYATAAISGLLQLRETTPYADKSLDALRDTLR